MNDTMPILNFLECVIGSDRKTIRFILVVVIVGGILISS